jgi:hypothetical protein
MVVFIGFVLYMELRAKPRARAEMLVSRSGAFYLAAKSSVKAHLGIWMLPFAGICAQNHLAMIVLIPA